jgi:hypothetical protein
MDWSSVFLPLPMGLDGIGSSIQAWRIHMILFQSRNPNPSGIPFIRWQDVRWLFLLADNSIELLKSK